MLNISDLLSSMLIQIRLSLFNLFLTSLTQINDLEVSNCEINYIHFLISHKMIIEIKISAIIKIKAKKEIKTEIEIKTETEIMIVIMKTETEVKIIDKITIIINEDLEFIAMSV